MSFDWSEFRVIADKIIKDVAKDLETKGSSIDFESILSKTKFTPPTDGITRMQYYLDGLLSYEYIFNVAGFERWEIDVQAEVINESKQEYKLIVAGKTSNRHVLDQEFIKVIPLELNPNLSQIKATVSNGLLIVDVPTYKSKAPQEKIKIKITS